jgi:hypothetical protein
MLQEAIACDGSEEKEKLAEIRGHVLHLDEFAVLLEEVGHQEPPDRAEPVVLHHFRGIRFQKGPTQVVNGIQQI